MSGIRSGVKVGWLRSRVKVEGYDRGVRLGDKVGG